MKKITCKLSIACCALTGASVKPVLASEPIEIDFGVMTYVEQERNTGIAFVVSGQTSVNQDDLLFLSAEFDSITGASPNGASPSNVTQTFTNSSGFAMYSTPAGETPVDDSHGDNRIGLGVLYEQQVHTESRVTYSSNISMEFDYFSVGAGINATNDFNNKNTALTYGFEFEYDRVHPVGGVPIPFASMQPVGSLQPIGNVSRTRRVSGLTLGVTQIINRTSLFQLILSHSRASGYLTDPYRIFSVIDDQNMLTLGGTLDYLYELRPEERTMNSIYFAHKSDHDKNVLDVSWRYYRDDWDVSSHTLDLKYTMNLSKRNYLRPHIRIYDQSEAGFYRHSLPVSQISTEFVSSDARLANFNAYTFGVKYGTRYTNNREQNVGIEFYRQQGDSFPGDAIGLQQQFDLYPSLNTLIFTYSYSYIW